MHNPVPGATGRVYEPSIRLIFIVVVQGYRERRMLRDNKCNVEGMFDVKNRMRKT